VLLTIFSTVGLFGTYIMRSPLTKTLYFEFGKSALFGTVLGYGYYRYQNYQFAEKIHKIYLLALSKSTYKN